MSLRSHQVWMGTHQFTSAPTPHQLLWQLTNTLCIIIICVTNTEPSSLHGHFGAQQQLICPSPWCDLCLSLTWLLLQLQILAWLFFHSPSASLLFCPWLLSSLTCPGAHPQALTSPCPKISFLLCILLFWVQPSPASNPAHVLGLAYPCAKAYQAPFELCASVSQLLPWTKSFFTLQRGCVWEHLHSTGEQNVLYKL